MAKIPVILDGDPGHDDVIAWVLAASSPRFDIKAVVALAGNVGIEKTVHNTLALFTLLGRADIPIARGAAQPMFGKACEASAVHGKSGLDGASLPEPEIKLSDMSGVELMADVLEKTDVPVTIIATGPLTDVALLLMSYPHLKSKIDKISIMGGGLMHGNFSAAAEFNILFDPEAAKIVFESGLQLVLAPLDVTQKALILKDEVSRFRDAGGKVGALIADSLEFYFKFYLGLGYKGAHMHDPCAVAYLLEPDIFVAEDVYVEIETSGQYCRGATVGDYYNKLHKTPNVKVMFDLDRERYVDMLVAAAASFGTEAK